MDFDLNEEQSMLKDLVMRFGADHYDPVKRLSYLREPNGFSEHNWKLLAETGLLAFALPESAGGFGGSDIDVITVMEALGSFVSVEPILPSVLLGAGVLWGAGTTNQRDAILPAVTAGERFPALALFEHKGRFDPSAIETRATKVGDAVRLSGRKQLVLGGTFATDIIVAAKSEHDATLGLYLVDRQAEGLCLTDYRLVDGSFASDIVLDAVSAQAMDGGQVVLDEVLDRARLAICAEQVGLMELMFQQTLEYLKTRSQFGQPLGAFQALQHRMADCYALVELSRSQLYRAAGCKDEGGARSAAIAGAKAYISESAMRVGEESVQLHGAIGVTEELMVGQAFKRVMALAILLGDTDFEISTYLALTADANEPGATDLVAAG